MKAILVFALLTICTLASAIQTKDYSMDDASKILADEPASASMRFAEVRGAGDVITFRDGASSGSSPSSGSAAASDGEDSEFDGQIAQVEEDIKRLKLQIKETQQCSHRLQEQKAEFRALAEQRDNLQKEKEKQLLQGKLDKQMKDLSEINRMSRALRTKFTELKRTQQMIKTKLSGTKSTLNQLDANPDMSADDLGENTKDIVNEVNSMQKAQAKILESAHSKVSKDVDKEITKANSVNMQGRAKAS